MASTLEVHSLALCRASLRAKIFGRYAGMFLASSTMLSRVTILWRGLCVRGQRGDDLIVLDNPDDVSVIFGSLTSPVSRHEPYPPTSQRPSGSPAVQPWLSPQRGEEPDPPRSLSVSSSTLKSPCGARTGWGAPKKAGKGATPQLTTAQLKRTGWRTWTYLVQPTRLLELLFEPGKLRQLNVQATAQVQECLQLGWIRHLVRQCCLGSLVEVLHGFQQFLQMWRLSSERFILVGGEE